MDEKLRQIVEGLPFTLNEGQLNFIYSYINGSGHFSLLGEAGSGKSLIIQVLKQYYGDEMLLSAATGVANQSLMNQTGGDGTAHRVFSLPLYMNDQVAMKKVKTACSDLFARSDLVKHVVVDEFYMLNPEHLTTMLLRIERFNKKTAKRNRRKIRILGVGDPCQIPAVLSDKDRLYLQETYGSHLMFRSSVWGQFDPTVRVLSEVMRQEDKVFKAALNVLRYGEDHRYDGVLSWLNKRVNHNYNRSMFTVATYNKTVEQVNNRVLQSNPNQKFLFKAKGSGTFNFKDSSVEEEITLSKGLECITLTNDQDGRYFNGSFCTITDLSTEGCYCYFPHNDSEVFIGWHEYEQTETYVQKDVQQNDGTIKDVLKKNIIGKCRQIPLLQSSAFSCHRSQGRTFSKEGVLDMGYGFREDNDFGVNLLYVGLSRWTDVNMIHLPKPLKRNHIKVCRDSINFWKECVSDK
ncbi:putative accessory helicase [Vibrio phage 249E41-1]|nr:putative accessory helicase [Vibrio phage 249E41-1]CAH9017559.1 putative accessory helicase [Vibrio phage 193E37-1]